MELLDAAARPTPQVVVMLASTAPAVERLPSIRSHHVDQAGIGHLS
jgi:hypothetical protein